MIKKISKKVVNKVQTYVGFNERPSKYNLFLWVQDKIKTFPSSAIIVDGACQTGWHIPMLFSGKENYIGIDMDRQCIEECKNKYSNYKFINCKLENMSSHLNNVDYFISTNTFCYISFKNMKKIFLELLKCMNCSGKVLIAVHFNNNYKESIKKFINLFEDYIEIEEIFYYRNIFSVKFEDIFSDETGYYGRERERERELFPTIIFKKSSYRLL